MLNTTEIKVNATIAELRAQRDALGDRAANLAAELAVAKAEKALLEGRVKNLEERLAKVESNGGDDQTETLREPSEAAPVAPVG